MSLVSVVVSVILCGLVGIPLLSPDGVVQIAVRQPRGHREVRSQGWNDLLMCHQAASGCRVVMAASDPMLSNLSSLSDLYLISICLSISLSHDHLSLSPSLTISLSHRTEPDFGNTTTESLAMNAM